MSTILYNAVEDNSVTPSVYDPEFVPRAELGIDDISAKINELDPAISTNTIDKATLVSRG